MIGGSDDWSVASRPEDVGPVDPDIFAEAIEHGLTGGNGHGGDDSPLAQFAERVMERWPDDLTTARFIVLRFLALLRLAHTRGFGEWARTEGPGVQQVHRAVIDVAARMPLNRDGWFDEDEFFRNVEAEARSGYPDSR
jgi:hypothetical protein